VRKSQEEEEEQQEPFGESLSKFEEVIAEAQNV
jgi:hypothetical protein